MKTLRSNSLLSFFISILFFITMPLFSASETITPKTRPKPKSSLLKINNPVSLQANAHISGTLEVENMLVTDTLQATTGTFAQNIAVANNAQIGGNLEAENTIAAPTIIALTLQANNAQIGGSLEAENSIAAPTIIANTLQAVNGTLAGNLTVLNNGYISGSLDVGGSLDVKSTVATTTVFTDTLQAADGTFAGNLTVLNNEYIFGTDQSSNSNTGALIVEGGVGIKKDLNVDGNIAANNLTLAGELRDINGKAYPLDFIAFFPLLLQYAEHLEEDIAALKKRVETLENTRTF